MKLAAIDIGTNSTRLLISCCKKKPGSTYKLTTLAREMEITRIGKNLDKTGLISKHSAEETMEVLASYLKKIKGEGVESFRVVGTSALRKAKNTIWFKKLVNEKLGINVEVITGRQEARLSFCGALRGVALSHQTDLKNILVIDIGGGSTEFILGSHEDKIILVQSIDLGCVNLTERFIKNSAGKPGNHELTDLNEFISTRLIDLVNKIKKRGFSILVGLAGTISTLAAVDLELLAYSKNKIHHHILSEQKIRQIYGLFCSVNLEERKKIAGLDPKRADIIISGTAILLQIMNMLDVEKLLVSEDDILDGIVYSLL
ncbi:MAG: Ppx/GppA family phosphatase [Actinomycetia bacterium]|nr:Ppx/GppA family phosphatase [Actinomycetota bacterium]MCG2789862.1 Ppx/GppA family phosphatase [Actinomycetes bacterium]